jgi:hypothetical protein
MAKDTSKSQGDAGGDKGGNQPEKGNKIGSNDKDHRHDNGGGKTGNDRRH